MFCVHKSLKCGATSIIMAKKSSEGVAIPKPLVITMGALYGLPAVYGLASLFSAQDPPYKASVPARTPHITQSGVLYKASDEIHDKIIDLTKEAYSSSDFSSKRDALYDRLDVNNNSVIEQWELDLYRP